jgi:hypothetical protein
MKKYGPKLLNFLNMNVLYDDVAVAGVCRFRGIRKSHRYREAFLSYIEDDCLATVTSLTR